MMTVNFLETVKDTSLKNELKFHFNESIKLAKSYNQNFVNIVEVTVSTSCWWNQSGTIGFDLLEEPGALYHEVFHSAFHCSELHKGSNEEWGNAFCDAFRYFTETGLSSEGVWHQKLTNYTSMDFDEIIKSSNDAGHDKDYAFPSSLIIKKV